jgi:hypothetical protein
LLSSIIEDYFVGWKPKEGFQTLAGDDDDDASVATFLASAS